MHEKTTHEKMHDLIDQASAEVAQLVLARTNLTAEVERLTAELDATRASQSDALERENSYREELSKAIADADHWNKEAHAARTNGDARAEHLATRLAATDRELCDTRRALHDLREQHQALKDSSTAEKRTAAHPPPLSPSVVEDVCIVPECKNAQLGIPAHHGVVRLVCKLHAAMPKSVILELAVEAGLVPRPAIETPLAKKKGRAA